MHYLWPFFSSFEVSTLNFSSSHSGAIFAVRYHLGQSCAESELWLPTPFRNMVQRNQHQVLHFDVLAANPPLAIRIGFHGLFLGPLNEPPDTVCDVLGELGPGDGALGGLEIHRRDLLGPGSIPRPLDADGNGWTASFEHRVVFVLQVLEAES